MRKDQQSLVDTINKVEKLQTAQQLTSTLLPPSSVNTMSSDDDKCFHARKLATWHSIALISDALTVTIMDTLQHIALTKYHLQAHQLDAGTTPLVGVTDQHLGIITTPGITTVTIRIGTDSVSLNLAHITLVIGVTVAVIPAEDALDPFTSPHAIAHFATGAPAHTTTMIQNTQIQQTPLQTLTKIIFQFTTNTLEA